MTPVTTARDSDDAMAAPMELDHVFILVRDAAADTSDSEAVQPTAGVDSRQRADIMAKALRSVGLSETFCRFHQGQGTANHRFQFDNVMLELLYVNDRAELSQPPTTDLQLAARFFDEDASSFGFCSRPTPGAACDAPYAHAHYRPAYLPPHLSVQFADGVPSTEPLWFHLSFATRPEAEAAPDRDHASGRRRVVALQLETSRRLSERSQDIANALHIELIDSDRDHLTLVFDSTCSHPDRAGLQPHPELPLSLA